MPKPGRGFRRNSRAESLVYLAERGVDEVLHRPDARAPRDPQVFREISGAHTQRFSLMAAFNESHLMAPMRFEGYGNTMGFNTWLELVLGPERLPGQLGLIAKASFH